MLTVEQIAEMTGARIISGPSDRSVAGISSFDDAGSNHLTFAVDQGYLSRLDQSRAAAVLVPEGTSPDAASGKVLLVHTAPKIAFFKVVEFFFPTPEMTAGIHPTAVLGKNVQLGEDIVIEANVFVGDNTSIGSGTRIMANAYVGDHCRIGDGCEFKPNVTVMDRSSIGDRVTIHSGTVIGSDGYGFAQADGTHNKLIHTGHVEIGDDAEIGACTTIDRGTLGVTRIGKGVKMDNQIHIAHNVKIGDNSLVVAQVGIAGSTSIGKNVIIAGKAGISGHLTIGDNAIVGPYAGVSANVAAGEIVSGIPHMPHKTWLKVANIISRLPGMRTQLRSLERRMNKIEGKTTE
ncbi:MAG TPA: UDP-3-O-(3-hydroxymyristoyl)glucosamine N-acyltransferase [Desulfobacteraceae bacterium]|nr:UDP-3-O-(3-hydroxymyristoyl)glucosamine N-acyltransferase [Desulfobacteraceae bacterium]